MGYIDTDIKAITVEIEEKEYTVAAKTVEIADRLAEAAKKCAGQPEYKLWLAELEVLLAKSETDYIETTLGDLLPYGFGPKNLEITPE